MQKRIVMLKAILSTRLIQQRYSVLSSIAALVPQKGNKEEDENMNAHHGQTLYVELPARSFSTRLLQQSYSVPSSIAAWCNIKQTHYMIHTWKQS